MERGDDQARRSHLDGRPSALGVDPKLLNNGLHSGQPKVTFTESLYRKILVRRPVKNFVSFSARNGIAPSKEMQIESMDEHLRNGLWNAFLPILKVHTGYVLLHDIWIEFFKQPIDRLPRSSNDRRAMFRDDFFGSEWNKVYDLIEFVCAHDMSNLKRNKPKSYISDILLSDHIDASEFVKKCNSVLERETSAWRIVNGIVTKITSSVEINAVETAAHSSVDAVNQHLSQAMRHLSNRRNPDYRNSIKESISAVEAVCARITKQNAPVLSKSLTQIEKDHNISFPPTLKISLEKLYAYTSSESGIRHAGIRDSEVTSNLAQFFLVTCSAFVNYLISVGLPRESDKSR